MPKHAFFFSASRSIAPNDSSNSLYGSPDWLTDIIVVDNPVILKDLQPSQAQVMATSAASPRVTMHWNVGDDQGFEDLCLTICKGTPAGNRFFVETILVLPEGTAMDESHPLYCDWVTAAQSFLDASKRKQAESKIKSARKKSEKS